jgi:hypothetical protein
MRSSLAVIPTTQFLVNDREPVGERQYRVSSRSHRDAPSASNRIDWSKFLIKTGLKTLSWKIGTSVRVTEDKGGSPDSPQTVRSIRRRRWSCCFP